MTRRILRAEDYDILEVLARKATGTLVSTDAAYIMIRNRFLRFMIYRLAILHYLNSPLLLHFTAWRYDTFTLFGWKWTKPGWKWTKPRVEVDETILGTKNPNTPSE